MKIMNKLPICAAVLGGLLPVVAAHSADYAAVTDARLTNPEPENWLMTRGNYQGWSYSPLDQINAGNVKKLSVAWTFSTGVISGHQSPPIVNNGVMFVSTPNAQVLALDAKTGDLIWRYKRELPDDFAALHNTNRGVALHGDKVYVTGLEPVLVALDAKTGKVVWEAKLEDYHTGYYSTMAPLIVKGKVMAGCSGGEFGVRGFLAAFDAETGKPAWKTFTVPEPGQPGGDTWPGDTWKRGGASVWMTPTYDPETDTIYQGTGNASPWFGDQRKGDNLYTSSTVAISPEDGKIKGYFQYHYNDSWDWDEMNAPMVLNYKAGGKDVKGLLKPARNGYLYWLSRDDKGAIGFVNATNYVKQDVFSGIDPKTGRPSYHADKVPGTGKKASFCPSLWGGKDWPFEAYNPKTGMVYIPSNDNHCGFLEGKVQEYVAGKWWTGVDIPDIGFTLEKGFDHLGNLQAWDVNGGKAVWSHKFEKSMAWGPVLTTGGGLVFTGGTNDRKFRAFDAKSGDMLWEVTTNSGITAPPSSYAVDGKQYVAVASGWGVDPAFQQGLINKLAGWNIDVPQGGVIWAFKLSE
ncbi:MAG: PQQ-dependent dehydrogenase, methanol/ethanol family [Gammaproteobacteria bacterium]